MLKPDDEQNDDILSCDESRKLGVEIKRYGEEDPKRWNIPNDVTVRTRFLFYPLTV